MAKKHSKNTAKPPLKGRATICRPDVCALICSLLAEGQSLVTICKLDKMPHVSTVFDWLAKGTGDDAREPYKAFADNYAHAREAQAELYASQIIDIADDSTQDELFTDEGKRVCNAEFVARSKLRVDARKWIASKLLPKKYGEKIQTELTGKDGGPVELSDAKAALLRGVVQKPTGDGTDSED